MDKEKKAKSKIFHFKQCFNKEKTDPEKERRRKYFEMIHMSSSSSLLYRRLIIHILSIDWNLDVNKNENNFFLVCLFDKLSIFDDDDDDIFVVVFRSFQEIFGN